MWNSSNRGFPDVRQSHLERIPPCRCCHSCTVCWLLLLLLLLSLARAVKKHYGRTLSFCPHSTLSVLKVPSPLSLLCSVCFVLPFSRLTARPGVCPRTQLPHLRLGLCHGKGLGCCGWHQRLHARLCELLCVQHYRTHLWCVVWQRWVRVLAKNSPSNVMCCRPITELCALGQMCCRPITELCALGHTRAGWHGVLAERTSPRRQQELSWVLHACPVSQQLNASLPSP